MVELREAGAFGFSDDGLPIRRRRVMRRALQYQRLCGGNIACTRRTRRSPTTGPCTRAPVSAALGLAGIPSVSESTMVARDAALAGYERARVRVSTCRPPVGRGRSAPPGRRRPDQRRGRPAPSCLTDEAVRGLDPHGRRDEPPLREERDRQALIEGLRDGTIGWSPRPRPAPAEGKGHTLRAAAMGVTGWRPPSPPSTPSWCCPAHRPRAAGRADGRRRRALRDRPPRPGSGNGGQRRLCGLGADSTVGEDGCGAAREFLVRPPQPHRPGADDRRRRAGRLPTAHLLPGVAA